ncbi:CTP pyrophosphohydrolase [Erysipelotrichaceae bacterium]|nr:CTP pyrophosphohydrolase [Erysipelotrichaceae bacterium]
MRKINVVCGIIYRGDTILCVQRSKSMVLPDMWEFPGGKIEGTESPEIALEREIKEELSCRVEVGEFIEKGMYTYDFGEVHLLGYACKLLEGEPTILEHSAKKWLKKEELSSLNFAPADIPIVNKIQKSK